MTLIGLPQRSFFLGKWIQTQHILLNRCHAVRASVLVQKDWDAPLKRATGIRGLIERVGHNLVASSEYGLYQLNSGNDTWALL